VTRTVLRQRGVLLKRVRQLTYLIAHPIPHGRCVAAVRRSRLASDPSVPMRYLGDHLALSLRPPQRRHALTHHHTLASKILLPGAADRICEGTVVWRRDIEGEPPLLLILRPAKLAPMEGELELSFSFRSELYVLTFLFAPGKIFNSQASLVLFVGGLQGRVGVRKEIREASKLNKEIAPSAMLLLAVRAIGRAVGADELLAVGEGDQISTGYAAPMIRFDYATFWTEAGGKSHGNFYSLPILPRSKPLSEVAATHRSRARRRRDEKAEISEHIELRLRRLLSQAPGAKQTIRS
jgi:uncharacterized protein VirK/YbjX